MNKKQNLLAIALSASFVLAGANVAEANEQKPQTENVSQASIEAQRTEIQNNGASQATQDEKKTEQTNPAKAPEANPSSSQDSPEEDSAKQESEPSLNDFINNEDFGNLFNFDKINAQAAENIETSPAKAPEAQKAPEESPNEPNYADDEKKIKDYSGEERYRSTEMPQGLGPNYTTIKPDSESRDGFSHKTLEPSETSGDKTQWGLEMEFDKEKAQRTYTDFGFTNTGNMAGVLDPGSVPAKEEGENLSEKDKFKETTYKAESEIEIIGSRSQRNLNLYAKEEDLKHINNEVTDKTIIAWEGHYKKDNPNGLKATQGSSAAFTFTVNPWPNENDQLSLIKLNGSHDKKEFVQGQTITTDVKVENLDASAR